MALSDGSDMILDKIKVKWADSAADLPAFSPSKEYNVGDIIWNRGAAPAGVAGWMCTVGGTTAPKWSPMAVLGSQLA
jgi:hypothetical protein